MSRALQRLEVPCGTTPDQLTADWTEPVYATVDGPLAVHRGLREGQFWLITHVPTGRRRTAMSTEAYYWWGRL